jgi:hypothetical protein
MSDERTELLRSRSSRWILIHQFIDSVFGLFESNAVNGAIQLDGLDHPTSLGQLLDLIHILIPIPWECGTSDLIWFSLFPCPEYDDGPSQDYD